MLDFSVTFIITIINIVILFFILRKVLFKPVTKFMTDRAKKIEDAINQAEKDKNQAKALLAQYEEQLKAAKVEAEAIINAAKTSAKQEAEKIIADGRIYMEATLANARKQLEMEHQSAMADFRKEAAALVVAATSRLLEREIKPEDSNLYADILLGEISHESASFNNEAGKS